MLTMLEEREEVIFQEYLEFAVLCHFDRRSARFICDEGDLSEKCSTLVVSDDFSTDDNIELPLDDIVGASV